MNKLDSLRNIAKLEQGGAVQNDQAALMQYLAAVFGVKSQEELQKVVQQLGADGIKQIDAARKQGIAPEDLQKQITGQAQKAEHGAKLNYLGKLKGRCPEGYEVEKFMSGGCVKCKKAAQEKADYIKKESMMSGGTVKKRITKKENNNISKLFSKGTSTEKCGGKVKAKKKCGGKLKD